MHARTASLAGAFAVASVSGSAAGDGWEAVAVLRVAGGNKVGKVKFEGDAHGTVVEASLNGITVGLDGYHGFHIHSNPEQRAVRRAVHECRRSLEPERCESRRPLR